MCSSPGCPQRAASCLPRAQDKTVHEARPAVHGDEHEQLERQGYHCRRDHHHAHRHENVRDDDVDDQEWQKEQKADLERACELRADERRQQNDEVVVLDIGAGCRRPDAASAAPSLHGW